MFENEWNKVLEKFPGAGPAPVVKYNPRLRSTAGRAFLELGVVELNPKIEHDFLMSDTLPHELAHIVAFRLYGDTGHGAFWKKVCFELSGQANRLHNQPVVINRQRRHNYGCSCGTHHIPTVTHNRIQRKERSYVCKNCGEVLTYKGE